MKINSNFKNKMYSAFAKSFSSNGYSLLTQHVKCFSLISTPNSKNLKTPQSQKNDPDKSDAAKLELLLKERFFYDKSFTIYGGSSGLYDLGPLGCFMQNNLIDEWRKHFVLHDKMLQIDSPILTPEIVLKASGHVEKFSDLMVKDTKTNETFRVDHLLTAQIEKLLKKNKKNVTLSSELNEVRKKIQSGLLNNPAEIDSIIVKYDIKSPNANELSKSAPFNLMFQTQLGMHADNKSYLRPETAQGIFVNFKKILDLSNQQKLPMAVAQIGKSFRNEINPKAGLIRQREFLMAEIEHFLDPIHKYAPYEKFKSVQNLEVHLLSEQNQQNNESHHPVILRNAIDNKLIKSETLGYYIGRIYLFCLNSGIDATKLRFRQHMSNEMAHYANECWDLEINTHNGWIECAGIADRCDYDLKRHMQLSGQNLTAFKTIKKASDDQVAQLEHFLPHVIEPSFGIGRIMYSILEHSLKRRPNKQNKFYLSLPYAIASYKCAILPLNESDEVFKPLADKISDILTDANVMHKVDDSSGSIGRRYWRADECGTPFAITIDYDSLKNETVTLRDRDTTEQIRIKVQDIGEIFEKFNKKKMIWNDLKSSNITCL